MMWVRLIWGTILLLLSGFFALVGVEKAADPTHSAAGSLPQYLVLGLTTLTVGVSGLVILLRRRAFLRSGIFRAWDDPWELVRLVAGSVALGSSYLIIAVSAAMAIDPPSVDRPSAPLSGAMANYQIVETDSISLCPTDNVHYAVPTTATIDVSCQVSFRAILGLHSVRAAVMTIGDASILTHPTTTPQIDRGSIRCVTHAPWDSCVKDETVSIAGRVSASQLPPRTPMRVVLALHVEYAKYVGASRYEIAQASIEREFVVTFFEASDPDWAMLRDWERYARAKAQRERNIPFTDQGAYVGYAILVPVFLFGAALILWPNRQW